MGQFENPRPVRPSSEVAAKRRAEAWIKKPFTDAEAAEHLRNLEDHRSRTLHSAQECQALGIKVWIELLTAPHACSAAQNMAGVPIEVDATPTLPLADCSLFPKCSCALAVIVADDKPAT